MIVNVHMPICARGAKSLNSAQPYWLAALAERGQNCPGTDPEATAGTEIIRPLESPRHYSVRHVHLRERSPGPVWGGRLQIVGWAHVCHM